MKNMIICSLLLLVTLIFAFLGVHRLFRYGHYDTLESEYRHLQQEIQAADSVDDHDGAIDRYKRIKISVPEVQLRILQRQWLVGLDILHQTQLAKYNAVLEKDVPVLFDNLKSHLEGMRDRCNLMFTESESLPDEIAWQAHNIKGSTSLMLAFIVLETEKNWKKVMGTMKEAISDFRSAIASVDNGQTEGFERNIPRWNLELLHGEQFVKKLKFTRMEAERRLDLRENLEAIIPEKGGYAPGEPLERTVAK